MQALYIFNAKIILLLLAINVQMYCFTKKQKIIFKHFILIKVREKLFALQKNQFIYPMLDSLPTSQKSPDEFIYGQISVQTISVFMTCGLMNLLSTVHQQSLIVFAPNVAYGLHWVRLRICCLTTGVL